MTTEIQDHSAEIIAILILMALLCYLWMRIFAEIDPSEPDHKIERKSLYKHIFRPSKERYNEDEI